MHVGDIDVIIDVYVCIYIYIYTNIYLSVTMECKKLHFSGSLPSAWEGALDKVIFFKKIKKYIVECRTTGTRQGHLAK
jgi:hypothetical protein